MKITTENYNEAVALESLLKAVTEALDEDTTAIDSNQNIPNEFVYVKVKDKEIPIILGGTQYDAFVKFIQLIADENGYEVDVEALTVTE